MTIRKTTGRASVKGEFVIGRARFAKISAVEGIKRSPMSVERAAEFAIPRNPRNPATVIRVTACL